MVSRMAPPHVSAIRMVSPDSPNLSLSVAKGSSPVESPAIEE